MHASGYVRRRGGGLILNSQFLIFNFCTSPEGAGSVERSSAIQDLKLETSVAAGRGGMG